MRVWEHALWSDEDEDEQPSAIGCDAPDMAGPNEPVSEFIRKVQCKNCNDTVQLPRRLVRGRRRCRCWRLWVAAMGVSGYRYSRLYGFDKTIREEV